MEDSIMQSKFENPLFMANLKSELESQGFSDAFEIALNFMKEHFKDTFPNMSYEDLEEGKELFKSMFLFEDFVDSSSYEEIFHEMPIPELKCILLFLKGFLVNYKQKGSYIGEILSEQVENIESHILTKTNLVLEWQTKDDGRVEDGKIIGIDASDIEKMMLEYINLYDLNSKHFNNLCKNINNFYDEENYDTDLLLKSYNNMKDMLIQFYDG